MNRVESSRVERISFFFSSCSDNQCLLHIKITIQFSHSHFHIFQHRFFCSWFVTAALYRTWERYMSIKIKVKLMLKLAGTLKWKDEIYQKKTKIFRYRQLNDENKLISLFGFWEPSMDAAKLVKFGISLLCIRGQSPKFRLNKKRNFMSSEVEKPNTQQIFIFYIRFDPCLTFISRNRKWNKQKIHTIHFVHT